MPRVKIVTSQGRARNPMKCTKCVEPIAKGEQYYEWAIKAQRGGTVYRQHVKHGPVRASQLTHSKISGAYAAIESAEDILAKAGDVEDIVEALRSCASDIEDVRDEYQESLDNMPEQLQQGDTGQQITEKIEALDVFATTLNDKADEIENEYASAAGEEVAEAPEGEEDVEEDTRVTDARKAAEKALGELSI